MADVFLSYASEDRERVRPLVEAMEGEGWTVWWDQYIHAGPAFREAINEAIEDCRCMVVAWSRSSIESDFVIDEATEAKRRKILVPLLLDDVQVPLGFRTAQSANLINGLGDLDRLLTGVSKTLDDTTSTTRPSRAPDEGTLIRNEKDRARQLPDGTVALWFADLEGSTQLVQSIGDLYASVLTDFRGILTELVSKHRGQIVDTEGDGVFAVFPLTSDAVDCAVATQQCLASRSWPEDARVAARIGLHSGEPKLSSIGYVGLDVHRAARIAEAGHGGQVLLSESTASLIRRSLQGDLSVKNLGPHRLRDLAEPEEISQLVISGLPDEFPPLRTKDSYPANIPELPTPTIGRLDEIAQLLALLERDDVHLVTVTGPGGVGKTRIALELAHRVRKDFRGGIFFVDFATASVSTSVIERVAASLQLDRVDSNAVVQFFRDRKALLILDNVEMLEARVHELGTLVQECADLKAIATSRRPLRLRSEHEFPLQPLPVPDESAGLEAVAASPAASLFLSRAKAVMPSFSITDDNVEAVAGIARRLDGLPLSIELAAARVKLFSAQELLERLEHPLDLLTRGPRDLPARQRTLRDAISGSYVLLSDTEQLLLRTLSAFQGGATIAMLESTFSRLGFDDVSCVVDGLAVLLDDSLATKSEVDGNARYSMLGTIREYCLEELEHLDQVSRVKEGHLLLFRDLAMEAATTGRQRAELARELENLRAALEFSFQQTHTVPAGLQLATALTEFWWARDPALGLLWLERGLETTSEAGPQVRARALGSAAILANYTRDPSYVISLAREALEICPSRDWESRANALGPLALALAERDEHEEAQQASEESVELLRMFNPRWPLAIALGNAGFVALRRGDLDAAEAAWTEDVELFRTLGDTSLIASPLIALGDLAMGRQEHAVARSRFDESLALSRSAGQTPTAVWALANLGRVAEAEGDPTEAALFYRESLSLAKELVDVLARDSRQTPFSLTSPGVATFGLAGASHWCLMQGRPNDAARLLGAVDAVPASMANRVSYWWESELKQIEIDLRQSIGDAEYERAHALGTTLSGADAIAMAMEVLSR